MVSAPYQMSPPRVLRLTYFLYFANVGAALPYLAPYLKGLGFSGKEIGAVQMAYPLMAFPAALIWATIADRLGAATRALRVATALLAAAVAFLPLARTPGAVAMVLLLQGMAGPAVIPLLDSITVEYTKRDPDHSYGRLRLFGSLGYIVAAQGLGVILSSRGELPADPLVPLTIAGSLGLLAMVAQRTPTTLPAVARPSFADAAGLLRNRALLGLLAICCIHWIACAPFHLFYGVFVRDVGLPARITGMGMAVGVAAEVVALYLLPRFETRYSARALLAVAFAVSALRWLAMSYFTSAPAVVLLQLFHGFTFGIFWGTCVRSVSAIVPPVLRVTGQAMVSAVVFGGGNAIGFALAGIGYDHFGGAGPLFAGSAAVELLALVGAARFAPRRTT